MTILVAAAPPASAQETGADSVRAVLNAFTEFSQAKNLAGMDTLVAGDHWVHIIEGAGVNHGWADYRDHHLGPELQELNNFRYRYFGIEPQIRGTIAWTPFQYELSADTPSGHVEVEGRGTAVFENRNRRWGLCTCIHPGGDDRRSERGTLYSGPSGPPSG